MDEQDLTCPVCKSDRYLNPQLTLCEACVNRLFTQGPSPCPLCKTILRKSNFISQTFEDLHVEKEIQIRQKVGRLLEDFTSLTEFNDYLEQVETIIFNLVNNIDTQATQEKIDKFRQENKDIIQKNISKQAKEDRLLNYQLEKEKREKTLRKEAYLKAAEDETKVKEQSRQALINQLALAETGEKAKELLAQELKKQQPLASGTLQYVAPVTITDLEEFCYEEFEQEEEDFDEMQEVYNYSFTVASNYVDPWTQHLKSEKLAKQVRGGGYLPRISYSRALQSAFSSILLGLE